MKKAINVIGKVYIGILVALTAIVTMLGCYQVIARYFLGWNISWPEEVMRYMYAAIIFYGIGLVSQNDSFVTITLFSDFVDKHFTIGSKILKTFQYIMQIIYFIVMAVFGWQLTVKTGKTIAPATGIPFFYLNLCLPVGGVMGAAVIFLRCIDEMLPNAFSKFKGKGAVEE